MSSNSSRLIENEVKIHNSNCQSIASKKRNGYNNRRQNISALLTRSDLSELRELIGSICLTGYSPSPEVDQIVTSFNRAGSNFTARLAVRALRLEQALNVAQERNIRLEWNLAQANKMACSDKE